MAQRTALLKVLAVAQNTTKNLRNLWIKQRFRAPRPSPLAPKKALAPYE